MTKTFQEWFDTLDWSNQKYLAENSRGIIKSYDKDGKETNYYSDIVAYKLKYKCIPSHNEDNFFSTFDRANKSLALIDETPAIQLNQVNVNINNEEGLDRESRLKVTEAVKAIMSRLKLQDPIVESDDTVIINEDVENESQEKLLNEENEENE